MRSTTIRRNVTNEHAPSHNAVSKHERRGVRGTLAIVVLAGLALAGCSSAKTSAAENHANQPVGSVAHPSKSATPTKTPSPRKTELKPVKQTITKGTDPNWAGAVITGADFQEIRFHVTMPRVDCGAERGKSSILFWGGLAVSAIVDGENTQKLILQAGGIAECSNQSAQPEYHVFTEELELGDQLNIIPPSQFSAQAGDTVAIGILAQSGIVTYDFQHISSTDSPEGPDFYPYSATSPQRYVQEGYFDQTVFMAEREPTSPNWDGNCPPDTITVNSDKDCRVPIAAWLDSKIFTDMSFTIANNKNVTLQQVPNIELVDMMNNSTGNALAHASLNRHDASISVTNRSS